MTDLTELTIAEARDALAKKSCSAQDLTRAYLAAMERGRRLNAYVAETPEQALAMAEASDARLARGAGGPLEGIPNEALIQVDFDTYLTVGRRESGSFSELAANDDGADGTDSRIEFVAPSSGEYVIRVKPFLGDDTGDYQLSVSPR